MTSLLKLALCVSSLWPLALLPMGTTQAQDCDDMPTVHTGGTAVKYAAPLTGRPGKIYFDANDFLYIGNLHEAGMDAHPAHIHRVDPVNQTVTICGPLIDDPDVLIVDREGILGTPGRILVGGRIYATIDGHVTYVRSDCSGSDQRDTDASLGNVSDFGQDGDHRILLANNDFSTVCVASSPGAPWSVLMTGLGFSPRMAVGENDIYTSADNVVRRYDLAGNLVDPNFASGTVLEVGPAGPFEGVIVSRADSLISVDPDTKAETTLLSGPNSTGTYLAFNSTGDLFLSQINCRQILRVTATPTSVAAEPGIQEETAPILRVTTSPNPFMSSTVVSFDAPIAAPATVQIFDVAGRHVETLLNEYINQGPHSVTLADLDVAAGVYLVRVQVGAHVTVKRICGVQ